MNERPARTAEEEALQLRKDARHEAGHAVAALHYGCAIRDVGIGGSWPIRGTTRLGLSHTSHAVVMFCGPFAEPEWAEFPGGLGQLSPTDKEALDYLELDADQKRHYANEAVEFLLQTEVQRQIDRVAAALLSGHALTEDQVRQVAQFSNSAAVGRVPPAN